MLRPKQKGSSKVTNKSAHARAHARFFLEIGMESMDTSGTSDKPALVIEPVATNSFLR